MYGFFGGTLEMTQNRDLHEHISQLAYQFYESRRRKGQPGNEQTDWLMAEKVILDPRNRIEITVLTEEYDYSKGRVYLRPETEDEERQLALQELAEEDLKAFFRIVGGSESPSQPFGSFAELVPSMPFPDELARYVDTGLTDETLKLTGREVGVSIPIINSRTPQGELLGGGGGAWPWAHAMATAIASICAAGGIKMFVELLKAWVEERKGRKIRIKRGDLEIEVQGGVTKAQVDQLIKTFEKELGPSRIIIP
jgi:hypothetical protein